MSGCVGLIPGRSGEMHVGIWDRGRLWLILPVQDGAGTGGEVHQQPSIVGKVLMAGPSVLFLCPFVAGAVYWSIHVILMPGRRLDSGSRHGMVDGFGQMHGDGRAAWPRVIMATPPRN